MLVPVLQKHINKGTKCDSTECPIALAIIDKLNLIDGDRVSVCDMVKVFRGGGTGGTTKYYSLYRGSRFIHTFDEKGKKAVKPFTADLRPITHDEYYATM